MENLTVTMVLYNSQNDFNIDLIEIYNIAKQLFNKIGYDYNYWGIMSSKIKNGKISHIKNERRLEEEIEKNFGDIKAIDMYSLIKDFKQAAFDYNVYMRISKDNVMITLNKSDFTKDVYNLFILYFRNVYCNYIVEVFEMDRHEWPLTYVYKDNDIDYYKTLVKLKL